MLTEDLFKPRTVHEQILHLGGEQEWKYMVQSYLACIKYVDAQIGRLLEATQREPRNRDTVIVLTSDHGWNLGEKTHWCKAAIWRDTTRVPFMVVLPGVSKAGLRNNQPISHVDIYPSLCDFAGIPKPAHLEGRSILPLLRTHRQLGTWLFSVMALKTLRLNPNAIATYATRMDPKNCTITKRTPMNGPT